MPSLTEHLRSPQLPDEEPVDINDPSLPPRSLVRFTGGWVAAGQPRWKAYAIYVTSLIGGAIQILLPAPAGFEVFTLIGFLFVAFGIYGLAETILNRRILRR